MTTVQQWHDCSGGNELLSDWVLVLFNRRESTLTVDLVKSPVLGCSRPLVETYNSYTATAQLSSCLLRIYAYTYTSVLLSTEKDASYGSGRSSARDSYLVKVLRVQPQIRQPLQGSGKRGQKEWKKQNRERYAINFVFGYDIDVVLMILQQLWLLA